jgi:hypothetical protein
MIDKILTIYHENIKNLTAQCSAVFTAITMLFNDIQILFYITCYKQEGHDGPEVAHLYISPRSRASLNPRAFI